jgi:hypothetical protein
MKKIGEFKTKLQAWRGLMTDQLIQWAEREYLRHHSRIHATLNPRISGHLDMLLGLDRYRGSCFKHASHSATRRRLAAELAKVVTANVRASGRRAYFITLIHDGWRTPMSRPVVDLREIRQRARDCLKFLDCEGVAVIEFDVITRPLDAPGGHLLAPHVHAVGFLDPAEAPARVRQLRASRRLRCEFGAKTVHYRRLSKRRAIRRTTSYMLKPALWTKRFVPRRNGGGYKLRTNRRRQTYLLGRLAEVLSYVGFKDLMLTCGDKTSWMTRAVRQASISHTKREPWLTRRELKKLWRQYWRELRRPGFRPPRIKR